MQSYIRVLICFPIISSAGSSFITTENLIKNQVPVNIWRIQLFQESKVSYFRINSYFQPLY